MSLGLTNAWTGGQYSLFRALFGLYLLAHFAALLPWAAEVYSNRGVLQEADASPLIHLLPNRLALTGAAAAASVFFSLGLWDRAAAIFMGYALASLTANPSMPFVGWMLLAHACLPSAPYGSWTARGRTDPAGGWRMPPALFAASWIVMALGYSYSACIRLLSPSWVDASARLQASPWGTLVLEVAFAPLACFRRTRPWIWLAMLAVQLGRLAAIDSADFAVGMVMLHLFTFDPAWLPPRFAERRDMVFYDGHCGLCHRAVRFLLAEDRGGSAFRFAPLEGEAFARLLPDQKRSEFPDSVVVRTGKGELLVRSRAVLYLMSRLGGYWRALAAVALAAPRAWLDAAYDGIARIRLRVFGTRPEACPLIPQHLRQRFDS